jgi:hypothetical protein
LLDHLAAKGAAPGLVLRDSARQQGPVKPNQGRWHSGRRREGALGVVGDQGPQAGDAEARRRQLVAQAIPVGGSDNKVAAEALKATTVCYIDKATVFALLDENPALGLQFLRHAAKELDAAEEKFLQSVILSVRARFAHLLLVLKDRYATTADDGTFSLELPLSRQDLAAMIGVRPETMSRTIHQFEDDDIAQFSGRVVRVPVIGSLLEEIGLKG